MRPLALCGVLAAAALIVPAGAQARLAHVSCGATITTDTKLVDDVMNCPNEGIVIGADNVTLDLNGHTVSGDRAPVASCPDGAFCDVGIDNTAGHTGVIIRTGAITGFDVGLFAIGGSANRVHGVSSADQSSVGMIVGNSSASRIDHDTSTNDGISGIVVFDSDGLRVDHSAVAGAHGYSIFVSGSSHLRVDHNHLAHNDHGIGFEDSVANEIDSNRISHSAGSSLDFGSDRSRIHGNVLTDSGDGIVGGGDHNVIADNTVARIGFFGFSDTGGFGLIIDGGSHDVIQGNSVTGTRGPAIYLTQLEAPGAPERNVIAHNVANSKLSDGILVDQGAAATLLDANRTDGNGHDGIHVDAPGTVVTRNRADLNANLGIEAVPGVIDGGGNRARGNGDSRQCTNIACW